MVCHEPWCSLVKALWLEQGPCAGKGSCPLHAPGCFLRVAEVFPWAPCAQTCVLCQGPARPSPGGTRAFQSQAASEAAALAEGIARLPPG